MAGDGFCSIISHFVLDSHDHPRMVVTVMVELKKGCVESWSTVLRSSIDVGRVEMLLLHQIAAGPTDLVEVVSCFSWFRSSPLSDSSSSSNSSSNSSLCSRRFDSMTRTVVVVVVILVIGRVLFLTRARRVGGCVVMSLFRSNFLRLFGEFVWCELISRETGRHPGVDVSVIHAPVSFQ